MNILLVGSGGREHALAWKLSQSKLCTQLYIAPGNPGTAQCGINVDISSQDIQGIQDFCLKNNVTLVVVGPEAPLVDGITDVFRKEQYKHINVVGPSAYAAQLEGSKAFAKKFMQKYDIPTAAYLEVTAESMDEGIRFLQNQKAPYVLKADGLAAGKGVLIIDEIDEAIQELKNMLSGKFGKASEKVVIEEFLSGVEFSVFALTDGQEYVLLPEAKDYKRIGEADTGLNTGGMGAVSPVPFVDEAMWQKVKERIVKPTIAGLHAEKMDYSGFVFFGLISVKGEPFVIEYNCRMGDPETEVVIPRIESDLVPLLVGAAQKNLQHQELNTTKLAATTVMMVSGGYPGDFEKYKPISGLDQVSGSMVFHAGTGTKDGALVTTGGRVLAITTLGVDFREAVKNSLHNASKIQFEGKYYRSDIGFDL
jgi:phosphoribosylamine---glycine ligase